MPRLSSSRAVASKRSIRELSRQELQIMQSFGINPTKIRP
jgi:hypothetical protein